MTNSNPFLSVIVPAHNAAGLIPDALGALARSSLPRPQWELIVVDDASLDDTSRAAQPFANRILRVEGTPRGPGAARNMGAAVATGEWLVFVDADVRVHSDTLSRISQCIAANTNAVALFGSYDDSPAATGIVSQYRNLLHRYVHLIGAGQAETFWAGCGAMKRSTFTSLGGFDTVRFPRPQIEDIELGYRLRDAGGQIVLDPAIQGTHLKRWTFGRMLRTDILDRGIPWMRLMLERRGRNRSSLNTMAAEKVKVTIAAVALLLLSVGVVSRTGPLVLGGLAGFVALVLMNLPVFRFFARSRGVLFAVATVPLHLIHYACNVFSAAVGLLQHVVSRGTRHDRASQLMSA